jgi:hypothetical protein
MGETIGRGISSAALLVIAHRLVYLIEMVTSGS